MNSIGKETNHWLFRKLVFTSTLFFSVGRCCEMADVRGDGIYTEGCIAWHRVSTLNGLVQTSSFWPSMPLSAKALSNISYSVSIIRTVMAFNRVFKYFCEVNDQETVRKMTWLNQRTVFLCTLKSCLMRLSNEIILWALNNMLLVHKLW